jgi:molybdopterin-guanine dinucleotide biosynthesis protein A
VDASDRTEPGIATRGAVLAGGRGSRLGGAKASADLAGRPLISYPLAALEAAGLAPFVVAKPGGPPRGRPIGRLPGERSTTTSDASLRGRPTVRPPDAGSTAAPGPDEGSTAGEGGEAAEVVVEPAEPTHPLVGILAALRHANSPVVVLGCDFPFVPPALLRFLAEAPEPLVIPAPGGDAQPLVARWSPALLPELETALAREEPLRRTVAALSSRILGDAELTPFGDPARIFFNVNTPADLRAAADLL